MRINKYIALATGISRRKADELINKDQVFINGQQAKTGQSVDPKDTIKLNEKVLSLPNFTTILLNKPVGYVCSRNGQGSQTIYDLLPSKYHNLKPIGRLDKDSSGLLILTNNGKLHQQLSHPSNNKQKVYKITLNQPLAPKDQKIIANGVMLNDGISKLNLTLWQKDGRGWVVTMSEGKNRQIRRTFAHLGYKVTSLHRIQIGPYKLKDVPKNQKYITVIMN